MPELESASCMVTLALLPVPAATPRTVHVVVWARLLAVVAVTLHDPDMFGCNFAGQDTDDEIGMTALTVTALVLVAATGDVKLLVNDIV